VASGLGAKGSPNYDADFVQPAVSGRRRVWYRPVFFGLSTECSRPSPPSSVRRRVVTARVRSARWETQCPFFVHLHFKNAFARLVSRL